MNFTFTCPYCNQPTTITHPNHFEDWRHIDTEASDKGEVGINVVAIVCPNPGCNKLFLKVELTSAFIQYGTWSKSENLIGAWQLLPESSAKVMPDYVPVPIREDYYEACKIRDLSPKASATLSRRCLQGMIRDFWGIKKESLRDELAALENVVNGLTWDAIDSVRSVGNIGAHMEKDINSIVNVESGEAQLLIGLIEQLIEDWYIDRHDKEERSRKMKEMALRKKEEKSNGGGR